MNGTQPGDIDPPEGSLLAAEYVLGVLGRRERDAVERMRQQDPQLDADIRRWEFHFMALAEQIAPVPPPSALWRRITVQLGWAPVDAPATPDAKTSSFPGLSLWRTLSFAGAALSAILAVSLVYVIRSVPPAESTLVVEAPATAPTPAADVTPMVATLQADDGTPRYVAMMEPGSQRITIMPMGGAERDGKVPELWLIPDDGKARSLGVFDDEGKRSHQVRADLLALANARTVLAVTREPTGGAPGGVATGPISAKGNLQLLAP
ncbi:MAG: anti-sigma factor [Pseudoxanthomonas sp.]